MPGSAIQPTTKEDGALIAHLDGWEIAERLQEPCWEKKPFLIALANYESGEDRCRSRQAGIDLHLIKPVDPDFLRRILERFSRIIMPSDAPANPRPAI